MNVKPQFPHSMILIGKEAQQMAAKASGKHGIMFQNVAMVSMCVMAAAGALTLIRDLLSSREDHGKGR